MAAELRALVESGTIRVIDMLILTKDEGGAVEAVELADVGELGELQAIEAQMAELLAEEDIEHLAAAMEPGSTAGVLMRAIERANVALEADDAELVSVKLTPHSLRHTTSSVRAALNDDPRFIADVLGHADVRFTFNVYAKAVARGEGEPVALRALVHGAPIDAEQAVAQSVSVVRQDVQ